MPVPAVAAETLAAVRKSPGNRVKVAVADIDGILRGKYIHKDKFDSAVEADSASATSSSAGTRRTSRYDNTTLTGWHKGFPDALARIDLGTHRNVPWDDDVRFLPRRLRRPQGRPGRAVPARSAAAGAEARAEARGEARRHPDVRPRVRMVQLHRDAAVVGRQARRRHRRRSRPGMFGYSLLRAHHSRDFFKALSDDMAAFGVPIEGLHTETGPGRLRSGDPVLRSARGRRPRRCCSRPARRKSRARFGIMPSFMAKWSQQYPGCSGHIAINRCPTARRTSSTTPKGRHGMSKLFESYLAGQVDDAARIRADVLADRQQLQAPRRRLLGAGEADVGRRQPHGELPRASPARRSRRGSKRAARAPDVNPYLAVAACIAAGLDGVEKKLTLTRAPIDGTNRRRREHSARAAHADRDDADLPPVRSRARLVRRRFRRPLRRHARMGMAAMARRGHRLGTQALLRDHLSAADRSIRRRHRMRLHRFSFPDHDPLRRRRTREARRRAPEARQACRARRWSSPIAALAALADASSGFVAELPRRRRRRSSPASGATRCESQVMQGVEAFKSAPRRRVIGIGGGAALDVAKAIALMAHHPGRHPRIRVGPPARAADRRSALPYFVALPTTAGTGSRGRPLVGDLRRRDARQEDHLLAARCSPRRVFADPELTLDLPRADHRRHRHGRADAQRRVVPVARYHPLCDGIALEGVRIAARALAASPCATADDLEARGDMLMSSMMGAIAFQKDLGAVHSCAHALSTVADLHHGLANGIMIDHVHARSICRRRRRRWPSLRASRACRARRRTDEARASGFVDVARPAQGASSAFRPTLSDYAARARHAPTSRGWSRSRSTTPATRPTRAGARRGLPAHLRGGDMAAMAVDPAHRRFALFLPRRSEARRVFKGKTLLYIEQSIAHWVMSRSALA